MNNTSLQIGKVCGNDPILTPHKWKEVLASFPEHKLYHLPEWFNFVEHTQKIEKLVYIISHGDEIVGYLPGFIIRKGPVKIFASPFEGWYTPYMGLLVNDNVNKASLLQIVRDKLNEDGFHFAQFTPPPNTTEETIRQNRYKIQKQVTYIADIEENPEAVLMNFRKSTRYNVRRAMRDGLQVRFTEDKSFIDVFYDQLCQVFAKSNMRPTYSKEKVCALWDNLMPTGMLKATEVVYENRTIATRLEVFYRDWMYAHGSASDQNYLRLRPNELARYHVMSYGSKIGVKHYDMMGGGAYKSQFGGEKTDNIVAIYDPYGLLGLKKMAKHIAKMKFKFFR